MKRKLSILTSLLKTSRRSASQQGFTLLESLVAIVVIAFVGVSITPPLFIAVATRVQNRKADQATQIAQGHVDRVRVIIERGGYSESDLPATGGQTSKNIALESAPTGKYSQIESTKQGCSGEYDGGVFPVSQALPVDIDGDCQADFYVQRYRSAKDTDTEIGGIPVSFAMGVRVYAANAQFGSLQTRPADLLFTSGEGASRNRPMAVIYTEVTRSDVRESFEKYKKLLD